MGLALSILAIAVAIHLLAGCSNVRNFDTTEERIIQADRDIARLQSARAGLVKQYEDEHPGKTTPLK